MDKNFFTRYLKKEFLLKSIAAQYIGFLIIGIFCFLIDFGLLFIIKDLLNGNIYLAVTIAFVIATYVNYLLNLKYVFEGGRHVKHKEIIYFFAIALGGLILTLTLMFILVDLINIYYLFAKPVAVFLVSIYSFLMRKYIVFIN